MRKVFRKKDKCGLSSHSDQAMEQGWGLQTTSPCASVNSLWDLTIWTGPWCMSILLAQIITQSTSLAVPIPLPICPALRGEGRGVCPTPGKPTVYPFGRIRGQRVRQLPVFRALSSSRTPKTAKLTPVLTKKVQG